MADRRLVAVAAGAVAVGVGIYLLQSSKPASSPTPAAAAAAPPPAEAAGGGDAASEDLHAQAKRAKDLGNKRFQGRQYDKACEEYTRAIELAPDKRHKDVAVFFGNRAQARAMLEKHAEAEADCDAALAIDPKYVKVLNRRGVARERRGDLEAAFSDFTAASLLSGMTNEVANEGGERVLRLLAGRRASARLAQPMRSLPSASFIGTFVDSFKCHRAILAAETATPAELGAAIASTPPPEGAGLAGLLCRRAVSHMRVSDYELALEDWLSACALLPPPAGGRVGADASFTAEAPWLDGVGLAVASVEQGAQALAAWSNAANASGGAAISPATALSMAGMFLHLRGNYPEAMTLYDYAIDLRPRSIDVLLKRASLWYEREEEAKAIADFEAALALDGAHGDIYCHRGQLYILQSKISAAVDDLRKAVQLDPGSVLARIQLGMALHRSQQPTEARRVFADAEAAFPDSPDVLNYHGELLVEAQEMEAAKAKFSGALSISGNKFALAHVNLGVLELHRKQDLEAAIKHCEKAISVDPLCETAHVHMAHLCLQKYDLRGAVAAYDRAVEMLRLKQELVDCYSMREATAAQLALIDSQPAIYEPLLAEHRQRAAMAAAGMG